MKLLLKLSYLGTNYCGYQVQKNAVSIQEKLQDCIEAVYHKRYDVTGCSRTDSGVHARCFYCTVSAGKECERIPTGSVPIVLNKYLPDDISVSEAFLVDDSFHPRYNVKYKEYEYLILNSQIRDPFYEDRAYRFAVPLDSEKMDSAAKHFCGKHDFRAFMASKSDVKETLRNVMSCGVSRNEDFVRIRISADGFLYNMVRIIVGTLIDVSTGKIAEADIPDIISSCDRSRAGFTAPPQGLYLNRVIY